MSAKIPLNIGSADPGSTGICRPLAAIKDSNPIVFKQTVLPPVFGPVITITSV